MKKIGFLAVVLIFLSSCNNEGKIKLNVDSLGKRLDTTLEKVWDSTKAGAGRIWDSTKAGAKRLKDKAEDKLDRKDSTVKKN